MIPTDRTLYLEVAKTKPKDKEWVLRCLGNVKRVLDKEKTTTVMVAIESTDESWDLGWDLA